MKFLTSLFFTLFFSGVILAQSDSNVSTLMKYEESPVDLSNGIPNVSVPFTTLPTRSKDISIDLALKYHPLNSVAYHNKAGDCGLGWNLFAGGVISRSIIGGNDAQSYYYAASSPENVQSDDIYQFNFMGYFGRFIIKQKTDGTLGLKVIKQKDSKLDLKMTYDSHFEVTTFTFFDEKGYRYIFDVIDNNDNHNSAYHLSSIIDNNNKELVHFSYKTCFRAAVFSPAGLQSYSITYNKLIGITANGFGKVTLTYPDIEISDGINAKLTELVLSDTKNNGIKKMKLFGTEYRIQKIQISDIAESKKEIYSFTYDNSNDGNTLDNFGYKATRSCGMPISSIGIPSPINCKSGVLTKMKLPTGGSMIYNYESNSYSSYVKDGNGVWQLDTNPNTYYQTLFGLGGNGIHARFPLIPENFIVNDVGNGPFPFNFTNTNSVYNFTITGTSSKLVYFKVQGDPYEITNPHYTNTYYPDFTLKRTSGITHTISLGDMSDYIDETSGLCLGQKIELEPGTYTVTITSYQDLYNNGTLEIKTVDLNPNPRKWFYGGGIRIKQIGYFANDAPSDYYTNSFYSTSDYNSQGYSPVKEKAFNYNFFGTSNSSGYLVNTDFSTINGYPSDDQLYFGGYKNVTVSDSQNNGKEEYTFKDGLDPFDISADPNAGLYFEDSKKGLLLSKKTYDNNASLLNSVEMNYDFDTTETGGLSSDYPSMPGYPSSASNLLGIGKLTKKTTTDFFANTQSKTVVEYFNYDPINYQLTEHTATNSLGETLKTEYLYDTNNSAYSQNRISEPSQTKMYRAGNLLSTNKVNYTNTWSGNQSYQPQTIESGKSTGNLEVKQRFNQYDQYGNLLEEQKENGLITSFIWGYNNTVIVAKLENIPYNAIPSNLIFAIQSTTDSSTTTEADVMSTLDALKTSTDFNLQNAMITTFTYKPLVGISTVTDAKGDKKYYEYDELQRLVRVRDKDNNILSENEYHYKN